MNVEEFREYCLSLPECPDVEEKWESVLYWNNTFTSSKKTFRSIMIISHKTQVFQISTRYFNNYSYLCAEFE